MPPSVCSDKPCRMPVSCSLRCHPVIGAQICRNLAHRWHTSAPEWTVPFGIVPDSVNYHSGRGIRMSSGRRERRAAGERGLGAQYIWRGIGGVIALVAALLGIDAGAVVAATPLWIRSYPQDSNPHEIPR